jgi:hypothetical protein
LTAKKGTYQGKLLSTNNQFQSSKKKGAKILGKKKKKRPSVSWKEEIDEAKQRKKCKSEIKVFLPCFPFFFCVTFQESLSHKWASNRPVHLCLFNYSLIQISNSRESRGGYQMNP